MNCIETLAQLQSSKLASEVFLEDTKAAYARMVAAEEASHPPSQQRALLILVEEGDGQERAREQEDHGSSRRPDLFPAAHQEISRE